MYSLDEILPHHNLENPGRKIHHNEKSPLYRSYRRCPYSLPTIFILTASLNAIILSQFVASLANANIIIKSSTNEEQEVFDIKELRYGMPPLDGIEGRIVLSDPENACSPINNKAPNDTDNWFLLAKSHPCQPDQQSFNAEEAGYKAIIIYNPDKSEKPSYQVNRKIFYDLDIISIVVSAHDGEIIKKNYLSDRGFTALITPVYPFPLLFPFAVIIIICLFLMVSFLIFQIIKCARDRRKLQRHRLTSKQLKQLLTTIYTKGSHYDTCAICLEEYVEGEKLRVLPCAHGYHLRCIDPWLTKSRRICPVCKGKVRVAGMSDVSDTESESDHSRQLNYNQANESTPLLRGQRPARSQDVDMVSPNVTQTFRQNSVGMIDVVNVVDRASLLSVMSSRRYHVDAEN